MSKFRMVQEVGQNTRWLFKLYCRSEKKRKLEHKIIRFCLCSNLNDLNLFVEQINTFLPAMPECFLLYHLVGLRQSCGKVSDKDCLPSIYGNFT